MEIYPIIISVPRYVCFMNRRQVVFFVSYLAKKAAEMSFENLGHKVKILDKNPHRFLSRYKNLYWSISHKNKYVVGVASGSPVGIDIEEVYSRSKKLYDKIASYKEWQMLDKNGSNNFFRYWTAKEAVLKGEQIGLLGLLVCSVEKIIDESHMILSYKNMVWFVEHFYFDNHIIAIATSKKLKSNWLLYDQSGNTVSF